METPAVEMPVLAPKAETPVLWTRPVRLAVIGALTLAGVLGAMFGTVDARNVTYNLFVDEGATTGIPRFTRERVTEIWRTMWDVAPTFGSVDLVRMTILIGGTAFVLAAIALVYLAFVPSRSEWVSDLSGDSSDTLPGD